MHWRNKKGTRAIWFHLFSFIKPDARHQCACTARDVELKKKKVRKRLLFSCICNMLRYLLNFEDVFVVEFFVFMETKGGKIWVSIKDEQFYDFSYKNKKSFLKRSFYKIKPIISTNQIKLLKRKCKQIKKVIFFIT